MDCSAKRDEQSPNDNTTESDESNLTVLHLSDAQHRFTPHRRRDKGQSALKQEDHPGDSQDRHQRRAADPALAGSAAFARPPLERKYRKKSDEGSSTMTSDRLRKEALYASSDR